MVPSRDPSIAPSPSGNALLRLVWMSALPVVLLLIALIADSERWTFGATDIVLVVLLGAAIAARAIDTLRFHGSTADGEPSTRAHVVRYAATLVSVSIAAWVVAQSVTI
ncbi:MAG: hypothetical protein IPH07_18000 [Deltaproteobacteria bacterium]|nr:hypothetical protein [Deltaproteobacteria bacterium]MBK8238712.1 hypothetical protein [Deltaproteobacteria bacterium]MBK8715593.1 hypothetical protein [Deltaproteobacteria bacterium]MBP7287195.1 hypothetical protein [Nannocystaceae bacterium]